MTAALDPRRFRAVVFDLDGVVTDTASVHEAAWRRLFDEYLAGRPARAGEDHRRFTSADYRAYVDGRSRYDGVDTFLHSRGIGLPLGRDDDGPGEETVCGLGNRKNQYFFERLEHDGAAVFADAVDLLDRLRGAGIVAGVVSASRNCRRVLERVGLADRFAVRVDGTVADELGLPGKPDPAIFLEAVDRLGVEPSDAVVVEDALAGIEAGRRGGFGLVIGVDREGGRAHALREGGADVVVPALDAVAVGVGAR